MPPICIVIPAYNAATTILATLDSLLPLADVLDTVVVSDDGSTDDTVQTAEQWGRRSQVSVSVVRGPNSGPGEARNRALAAAVADWVLFLDADDVLLPDGVRALLSEATPDLTAVIGGREDVLEDGSIVEVLPQVAANDAIDDGECATRFLQRRGPSVQLGSVLARRNGLTAPVFPDARVGEDLAFIATLLAGGRCRFIDTPVVRYQVDPGRQLRREAGFPDDLLNAARFPFARKHLSSNLTGTQRRRAEAAAHLTLVRALSKTGDVRSARNHWRLAYRLDSKESLRWVYLKRLVGGFGRTPGARMAASRRTSDANDA